MYNKDHDIEFSKIDLLNNRFLGVVEDPNDPRKEGRAKIRVISIHGTEEEISVNDLPWAYPIQKSTFFGMDGRAGSISIPKKGAIVSVQFNNGDPYCPEYTAVHEIAEDIREELSKKINENEEDDQYLGSHVILFDGDAQLKLFYTIDKGLIIQLINSRIEIDRNQKISIEHGDGNSSIEIDGQTINVVAKSTVNVTAPTFNVDSTDIVINGSSKVDIGNGFLEEPAVLGDSLALCLDSLATLIDAKYPVSVGTAAFAVNNFKALGLSKTVKISK